jgi:hypothetical protein
MDDITPQGVRFCKGFFVDRRGSELQLGLALQSGFLRRGDRGLGAVRIVPGMVLRHVGEQLHVAAPDLATPRAMDQRGDTLFGIGSRPARCC